jgi:hypothetical protein
VPELDLTTLPVSSVPAAFDRGHLHSPTSVYIASALAGRYDYRPGDLYEPMPDAPAEPKAFVWWFQNIAKVDVPDFLALHVGDEVTIQHVCSVGVGAVVATWRFGAQVRWPMPEGSEEPFGFMTVRRRNHLGHWYP